MKKTILASAVLLFVAAKSSAQQEKLITHFIYDKMSLNPGSTGLDDGICATTIYRNQWDKVNGAPNSAVLNLEANMNRFFPGGLGISFYHDAIGFYRQNNVLLNYSYPLQIQGAGTLGIGLGIGLINFGADPTWVPPTNAVDNSLPAGWAANNMDMNFGLYFKGDQDYYVGFSTTHMNQSILKQTVGVIDNQYSLRRNYYLMAGKKFKNIASGDIDVQMLLRTELVKYSAEINARYLWRNIAYGGLTFRTSDAVGLMLGYVPFTNFTVGYSYDITVNQLSSISRGSHEILMKYCYHIPPPPITKSKHPRWL
jgi:type IX secretion system PorP/SprF family membrane protein